MLCDDKRFVQTILFCIDSENTLINLPTFRYLIFIAIFIWSYEGMFHIYLVKE